MEKYNGNYYYLENSTEEKIEQLRIGIALAMLEIITNESIIEDDIRYFIGDVEDYEYKRQRLVNTLNEAVGSRRYSSPEELLKIFTEESERLDR